jgi:hypothetical protein
VPTTEVESVPDRGRFPKTLTQLSSGVRTFPEPAGTRRKLSLRKIERGILATPTRLSFSLKFERFPIWLLTLESNLVTQLIILGHNSQAKLATYIRDLGMNTALLSAALNNVGTSKIRYTHELLPPPGTILLVSGSLPFIKSWSLQVSNQVLVLCDEHVRQRQTAVDGHLRWQLVRHETFGGVTHFQTLMGSNIPDFEPTRTTLRRTLRHIIDYSLKPRWSSPPSTRSQTLSLESRLHPGDLTREVCYHTHFSATGWGTRSLSSDEIGIAFGWPSWARKANQEHNSFRFVPVQIMDGILRSLVSEAPPTTPLQTPIPKGASRGSNRSWLPSIQKFLPHSWIDSTLVSAKAAKRDDAGVPSHLWDQRCSLVLPHCTPALSTLREFLSRALVTRLWDEFYAYLRTTHGEDWRATLSSHKQRVEGRFPRKRTRGDKDSKERDRRESESSPADELAKDVVAGIDAIGRLDKADWWTWKNGSTLLYWRWPAGEQRRAARDGMPSWIKSKLPRYQRKASTPNPLKKHLIWAKLQKILDRRYVVAPVTGDFICSLMDFFDVDKDTDIRLVYNGTSCGLNASLWAPNFWLPTPATAARSLGYGYFMADIDLGEMFLNFPLHRVLQRFSGVDLTHYLSALTNSDRAKWVRWVHWTRCWMGLKPSPYMAVRFYYWAEEFGRGNRRDLTNPLRWDFIKLNLLGDPTYDPTLPRVMKWDSSIKNIAGDLVAFIDDLRASGISVEKTWAICRQVTSRLQYMGIQDAPRKRRPPVRNPGAWAGSVFITTDSEVRQTVSQAKWDKAMSHISELLSMLAKSPDGLLDYKRLEEIRGFLGHIAMTYLIITPYLKGLHLTLASFHPGRNEFGWKLVPSEWSAYLRASVEDGKLSPEEAGSMERDAAEPIELDPLDGEDFRPLDPKERKPLPPPPKRIKAAPRLVNDVRALNALFDGEMPTQVLLRSSRVYSIFYGFADASGSGFGSTILCEGGIKYRIGTWGSDSEDDSSNFREFENVVDTLRDEAIAGNLKDSLIILCTDNSTVESSLVKGNSSSEKLFNLTLEVRLLEMREGAKIVVSHVSGERMKAQGTDGVSRGQLKEGVSTGQSMLSFVPFHLSAIQRSESVEAWLRSWLGESMEVLSPEGWFERGHDHLGGDVDAKGFWRHTIKPGTFVWSPAPAAASVAIEELRKARIKRQDSLHVFVCPRLLKPEWFRHLYKASDIVFDVPAATSFWSSSMFEPLIIGIAFPYLSKPPWQLKSTPKMFHLGRQLRRVWDQEEVDARNILYKFLLEFERIRTMPADVVRRVLYFQSRCPVPREERSRRRGGKRKRPSASATNETGLGKETSGVQ